MQNKQIPDSSLRASSSYNLNSMGPRNGRLHFQGSSGQHGAWAVSTKDEFQYFEVNFGEWTKVTKVATQGRQDGGWWVTSYCLSYSYGGMFFEDYKEDGVVKVFYDYFVHIALISFLYIGYRKRQKLVTPAYEPVVLYVGAYSWFSSIKQIAINMSTSPWMGCKSITGLPPALNLAVNP